MADINIERKGNSVWPWIVGLLLLAVVVFVVMRYKGGADDAIVTPVDSTGVQQAPAYQPAPPPSTIDSTQPASVTTDSNTATTTSSQ